MTYEQIVSVHKVMNVIEKYRELQEAVQSLTRDELQMLIRSLKQSPQEENA